MNKETIKKKVSATKSVIKDVYTDYAPTIKVCVTVGCVSFIGGLVKGYLTGWTDGSKYTLIALTDGHPIVRDICEVTEAAVDEIQ